MSIELPIKIKLPSNFLDEETRCGYFISSDMKAVWAVELDLLSELDKVCKRLSIKYFLDAGNLLGAVRDGKFIPWDDDIDLVMLRNDYDKLMKDGLCLFQYPYFLQCPYSDKEYARPHAQLRNSNTCAAMKNEGKSVIFNQGIFIDIFPLDGILENDLNCQIKMVKKIKKPAKYISFHHSKKLHVELFRKIRANIYKAIYGDIPTIFERLDNYVRQSSEERYVDKVTFRDDVSKICYLKKSWFEQSVVLEFEEFKCAVPSAYDEILKAYYGTDYMTPKQQSTVHGGNGGMIFDAYKPYKDVLF